MQIWPHSATLSEVGAAQAGSGPALGGPQAGGMAGMMPAPNAGEVLLNRAETAALAAMEGEEDEAHGLRRAQAESGLTRQQLTVLKRRADHLSSKGYTLKGPNFVKKALASSPDEPGLTRKGTKGQTDEELDAPAKPKAKPAKKKTTEANEANALVERHPDYRKQELYTCPELDDYRLPQPNSMSEPEAGEPHTEANSSTTMAALLAMRRKRAKS
jgi:hypothetical protein